jgi:sulfate adenylyltransferase subunit 1
LEKVEGDTDITSNDIARLTLKTTVPLCVDSYRRNRETGSLILIDEATNVTVAAGMIA